MKDIKTPILDVDISGLCVGDMITLSGIIYTGRDAILPRLCELINLNSDILRGISLEGSAIFHTAVSIAGVGPTSSNKIEIESSIPILSKAGVKAHLGKGEISKNTVEQLKKYNSLYAVIPPVTALLNSKIVSKEVVAFPEQGMEAMYKLEVVRYPAIVAAIHGKSIYDKYSSSL